MGTKVERQFTESLKLEVLALGKDFSCEDRK